MKNRLSRLLAILACLALALPATGFAGPTYDDRGRLRVGEDVEARFETDHPYSASRSEEPRVIWSETLHRPGASYITPHFERFELAEGDYLVVRSPDGSRSFRYERFGKREYGRQGGGGFWGSRVPGDTAVLELFSRGSLGAYGVAVDRFARGFTAAEMGEDNESICTADDKENAICYESTEAEIYDKARAVVRLFISGSFLCTGWLLGDEGHMMTNEHCITNQTEADNTDYEFMAEGAMCSTVCGQLGCDGTIEADMATFIQDDIALDYALVELPTNLSGTYGFLQFRETGAVLDERIYSPQHPGGRGKEIAVFSTYPTNGSGFAEVDSLVEPVCSGGATLEVGYFMDTEGGSSGSPVLGYSDHLVIALHHCRGANFCTTGTGADDPNRGVPPAAIIADLGPNLPNNATGLFSDGFESGDTSVWDSTVD